MDARQNQWLDRITGTSLSSNIEPDAALANLEEEIRNTLPSRDFSALDAWMGSAVEARALDGASQDLGVVDPKVVGTASDEQVAAALLSLHFPPPGALSGRENDVIRRAESIIETLASKSPTFKNVVVAATVSGTRPLNVQIGGVAGPTASYARLTNIIDINRNSLRQGADLTTGHIVFEMINAARISAALRIGRMAKTGYYEKLAQTLSTSEKPVSAADLYAAALEAAEYPGLVAHHSIFEEAKAAGAPIGVKADLYADNFDPAFGANFASLQEYLSLQLTTEHTARYARFYSRSVQPGLSNPVPSGGE
jgi:hypothetical protein